MRGSVALDCDYEHLFPSHGQGMTETCGYLLQLCSSGMIAPLVLFILPQSWLMESAPNLQYCRRA